MADRDLPGWMRHNLEPDTIDKVVTRLNRVRPKAQKKLAKDIVTIAYLEAGRRLIERYLQGLTTEDSPFAFLDWLTRDVVYAEVEQGPEPLPKQAGDGTFRDRWRSKEDYLADLIAYINWDIHREPNRQLARKSVASVLDPNAPLAAAIQEAAYEDLMQIESKHASVRFTQLAIQPLAAANPAARAALCNLYAETLQLWGETYRKFLDGRRMRLRSDVNLDDLAIILTAVVDGLALRSFVEGTNRVIDHEARTSLLGTTALALLIACVDHGDSQSMSELVNELGRRFPPVTGPDAADAN